MRIERVAITFAVAIGLAGEAVARPGSNPDPEHIARPGGAPAQPGDAVICLYPRNDPAADGDNLQWSVDNVAERGAVLLQEGTFRVGRTGIDASVHVSTKKGGFDFASFGGVLERAGLDQFIDVRRPVTIRGAIGAGPSGGLALLTTIAVPQGMEWRNIAPDAPEGELYSGFAGSIVLNAPGIRLEDIRFEEFAFALFAFFPGFDVRGCEFRRCAYPAYLLPDGDETGASAFRDCVLTDFAVGLHVVGSDVTVAGNRFSATGSYAAIAMLPWRAFQEGPPFLPAEINWDRVEGNVVCGNSFDLADRLGWELAGMGVVDFTGWSGPFGMSGNRVSGNEFRDEGGSGAPYVALAGPGADRNDFIANDYRSTDAPGWSEGAGCIFIDPVSVENFVVERRFPEGTDVCDQLLDADDFDGPIFRRDPTTGTVFDLRTEGLVDVDGVWTPLGEVLPVYGAASQYLDSRNGYFVREQRVVRSPYSSRIYRPWLPVLGPVVVAKNTRVPGWAGLCGSGGEGE